MNANRPYDDQLPGRGYPSRTDPDTGDHEISLGTPTILGIFFALALVCAAFFGFGYTLGRRSVPVAIASDPLNNSGAPKPSASLTTTAATPESSAATPQTTVVSLTSPSTAAPAPQAAPAAAVASAATPQPATSSPQPATSFVVQVAAVSSQDVADILTSSLEKKGYTVAVRHEPQDKLLHVQIGPFTDKKDAQAMQARVLADGFNAIVK